MAIRLKYRQGSFVREEERISEPDAIARAEHLIRAGTGCSCFQIVDHRGNALRSDSLKHLLRNHPKPSRFDGR